jgi:DNA-binding MarR family transcriptional regulator
MDKKISAQTVSKIRKLAELAIEVQTIKGFAISITRLTTLKSLCSDAKITAYFALHIAKSIYNKMLNASQPSQYKDLVVKVVCQLEGYIEKELEEDRLVLRQQLSELKAIQNKYRNASWGVVVRIIENRDLLIVESTLECVLAKGDFGYLAYQLAKDYAEGYEPRHGTGLIPSSAPMLENIVNFFCQYYFNQPMKEWLELINHESEKRKAIKEEKAKALAGNLEESPKTYTAKQGQFLAFIYYYTKIHKQSPSQADIQKYFATTPSSVHQMLATLQKQGLITVIPGKARSITLLLTREDLPDLD